MGVQTAVVPQREKGTATTSTAGTPRRFRQLAAGCATPPSSFAALDEITAVSLFARALAEYLFKNVFQNSIYFTQGEYWFPALK
jgi:hypothetical protein